MCSFALLPCKRIRAAIKEGYKLEPHFGTAEGTRVRFRNGIFSGADGIASKLGDDRFRVVLALSGIQQCSSVESESGTLGVVDQRAS
jgi:hypothetical protein